jgi:hypothetical protein
VLTLTIADLNYLFANATDGVMLLVLEGNLNHLQIDVPLRWFLENPGAILLVFNAELGLMAVTAENMIELAALAYEGVGGVSLRVRGNLLTFNPDTIISYIMEKGSTIITVTANGESMDWYIYNSPLILGFTPERMEGSAYNWVMAQKNDDGTHSIISRSLMRDFGLVYGLINNEGHFVLMYNPKTFKDIEGLAAENAINFLASRGIVHGVGDDMFEPNRPITRGEFAAVLANTMDFVLQPGYEPAFPDVYGNAWYYQSVTVLAVFGIADSIGDGNFGPDFPIRWEDIYTMTYRALVNFYLLTPGKYDVCPLDGYMDSDELSWYAERAVRELAGHGLLFDAEAEINPHGYASRAEAALFMESIIRYIMPDFSDVLREVFGN